MRLVIQRVKEARVVVNGSSVGEIQQGLLVFLGIHKEDDKEKIPWLVNKLVQLRVFEDDGGKMNQSVGDVGGEILLVSQFTLYASCNNGRRPDFGFAAKGEGAKELYGDFVAAVEERIGKVQTGQFGACMEVSLINDGPATFIIDSK